MSLLLWLTSLNIFVVKMVLLSFCVIIPQSEHSPRKWYVLLFSFNGTDPTYFGKCSNHKLWDILIKIAIHLYTWS